MASSFDKQVHFSFHLSVSTKHRLRLCFAKQYIVLFDFSLLVYNFGKIVLNNQSLGHVSVTLSGSLEHDPVHAHPNVRSGSAVPFVLGTLDLTYIKIAVIGLLTFLKTVQLHRAQLSQPRTRYLHYELDLNSLNMHR